MCRAFVALCRELNLLVSARVAIDGSKFKAVNARDKNFTEAAPQLRAAGTSPRLTFLARTIRSAKSLESLRPIHIANAPVTISSHTAAGAKIRQFLQ